jgi:hypothetical protein
MKWVMALVALGLVAACSEEAPPPPAPAQVAEKPLDPECQTVKIFSKYKFAKPTKTMPEGWKPFIGVWGKAGWQNNTICHDLYVLSIDKDGKVMLIDAHGPDGKFDGSAFQRVGQIGPDNRLRIIADGIPREYWIEDGKLRGIKFLSSTATHEITMTKKS